jgi:hypothetical protein
MKINCHVKKMCLFEYESLINGINYLSINIEMRREVGSAPHLVNRLLDHCAANK